MEQREDRYCGYCKTKDMKGSKKKSAQNPLKEGSFYMRLTWFSSFMTQDIKIALTTSRPMAMNERKVKYHRICDHFLTSLFLGHYLYFNTLAS